MSIEPAHECWVHGIVPLSSSVDEKSLIGLVATQPRVASADFTLSLEQWQKLAATGLSLSATHAAACRCASASCSLNPRASRVQCRPMRRCECHWARSSSSCGCGGPTTNHQTALKLPNNKSSPKKLSTGSCSCPPRPSLRRGCNGAAKVVAARAAAAVTARLQSAHIVAIRSRQRWAWVPSGALGACRSPR